MKRRDILISVAIVVAALLACYVAFRGKGLVTIEPAGAELQLEGAFFNGVVGGSDAPTEVPIGTYRPGSLTINGMRDGDRWTLTSTGPWGELEKIEVAPMNTTVLKVGPPFQVVLRGGATGARGFFNLYIFGCAGEQYSSIVLRHGGRTTPPKLTVLDREGNVLTSDHFAYGFGGGCSYSWQVPTDFSGEYRVAIELDLGPFEYEYVEQWRQCRNAAGTQGDGPS